MQRITFRLMPSSYVCVCVCVRVRVRVRVFVRVRMRVRVCVCVYAAFVDLRKTVWDRDAFFYIAQNDTGYNL